MLEWLFRVVNLVNLDHQGNRHLLTVRPSLADVLARDRVNVFEIGVAPPLRYPPAKLRLAIGIVHINDGDGHPRIAPRVPAFDRILIGADDDAVAFASHPALDITKAYAGKQQERKGELCERFGRYLRPWS